MITTVRRRQFDTRAVQWLGTNEAEVRQLCPGFTAIPEEDREDDSDATGEGPFGPHGNRGAIYDGDYIVAWPGGGWRRYRPDEYAAEFELVAA
jgi:hypothetical protein